MLSRRLNKVSDSVARLVCSHPTQPHVDCSDRGPTPREADVSVHNIDEGRSVPALGAQLGNEDLARRLGFGLAGISDELCVDGWG